MGEGEGEGEIHLPGTEEYVALDKGARRRPGPNHGMTVAWFSGPRVRDRVACAPRAGTVTNCNMTAPSTAHVRHGMFVLAIAYPVVRGHGLF